jgi:VanZ family protein
MVRTSTLVARILLAVAGLVCVVGMVGPFQGVEEALIPWDKAAHFVAFYGLTSLLYVAFPRFRRVELTLVAIFAGCGIEIAQGVSGRDMGLGDIFANSLGALAVLSPMYLQEWRSPRRSERRRSRASAPSTLIPAKAGTPTRPQL